MKEETNLGRSNPARPPLAAEEERKTYRPPRLVEYGDLHRLTQSATSGGVGSEDASLGSTTVT